MLRKAAKAHEAAAPLQTAKDVKSVYFLSSSPTARDGDIRKQFSGRPAAAAAVPSREVKEKVRGPSQPLIAISANAAASSGSGPAGNSGKLASLCGGPPSFDGSVHDQGAVAPISPQPTARIASGVALFDDDFDDTIDLDFEEPTPLPSLPPARKAASAPELQPAPGPPESSREEAIPWSTSPLSHFAPPLQKRSYSTASSETLKRQSSKEDAAPTELVEPLIKKRKLPSNWQHEKQDMDSKLAVVYKTPASNRPEPSLPWATTASVEKERTKQLNAIRQHKKESSADAGGGEPPPRKETGEITRAHMSKAFTIALSKEQQKVLDLVVNQHQSVFFTGPAGTGKSVLMRAIISALLKKYAKEPERVAVTASTGLAACNIGGITLHSFAGIGLGKEDAASLVRKVKRNPKARMRWLKTKCLIIDEISMVDGDLFDKLSQIGRTIRNNGRPWGGIQLIITGDFFQLPPVPESNNGGVSKEAKFAFDAATWNTSIDHTIGLTQVFRQKDSDFANMLNEMRLGKISDRTIKEFQSLSRPLNFTDGIGQTELFPRRQEVDNSNERRLRELPGDMQYYTASDAGDQINREKLLQNMMAPKQLALKTGAQVMLIKNLDEQLVNGTLGKVVDFADADSLNGGFDEYDDPLSKARRKIKSFSHSAVGAPIKWPVVDFSLARGVVQRIVCEPHDWKVELPSGEVQASRRQVPLILAWALSIHKAQGQTLERVRVDLSKVFEKGQAYVALSRATSREGLQVLGFAKSKVMAHQRVIEFYNRLYSVGVASSMLTAPIRTIQPTAPQVTKANVAPAPDAKPKPKPKPTPAQQRPLKVKVNKQVVEYVEGEDDEQEFLSAYGC